MKKVFASVMVSILILGLAGCGKTASITIPTDTDDDVDNCSDNGTNFAVTTANFNPMVLANTTWILKSYGDAANMIRF